MRMIQIPTMATLALALGMSLVVPTPADAGKRQFKNTIGGAAIGAGVGALIGGSNSVATGAIVGGIAGALK